MSGSSTKLSRFVPRIVLLAMLAATALSYSGTALAAPANSSLDVAERRQIPDWLSPESASRLAVGIDVLVPSYVPAPFGGEPEVQASDGYYSLYWLIPGAPPTYLRVTGEAGGVIPDFSYYDRNVQLVQNADVQGYPAYHDVTPIYDLIYWDVGGVVYTVESHNLAGDDSIGVANSLMYMVAPETGGGEGEPSNEVPTSQALVSALGVPPSVVAGEIASIGSEGTGDIYLVASDGYFLATGEAGVVTTTGIAVDWQAPEYESDTTVTFTAYDLSTEAELASAQTVVHGYAAVGESTAADVQCPGEASAGKEARVLISGNGTFNVISTEGSWPIEPPNTDFQANLDGGASITGTLSSGDAATLSWLAPVVPTTAFVSITNSEGTLLDECSIAVVEQAGEGDLGAPASAIEGQSPGDGTGINESDDSVVLRVIANPIGFAGDASGGPEANGPDYGLVESAADANTGSAVEGTGLRPISSSAKSMTEAPDAELGPSSGADGMYATVLGTAGGTLSSPYGATIRVPPKCLPDQTTVMLKPVDDRSIPTVLGIATVPGTAFDVSFGGPDGRSVGDLNVPALLTIALQSASTGQNARIYRVEGSELKPMPETASDTGSVSTEITGLSRFVVGVPQGEIAATSEGLNPLLIGGLGLVALASAALLISRGFQRRKPKLIPTRRPAQSRVRYR